MTHLKYRFEICEEYPSADFIFDAYGNDLNELFAACASACFYAMTDLEKIKPVKEFAIELKADSAEELLYSFISELIYLKDTEKVFLSVFNVKIVPDGKSLLAAVSGESIDYDRHTIKTDVKAATYHDLKIEKVSGGYKARMILDL
jgi:SHS2 domain-containing protein